MWQEAHMYESDETTTVAIKHCRSCGAGLLDDSRFCRSCGIAQSDSSPLQYGTNVRDESFQYTTNPLSRKELYHPVSGPLVSAVVAGVPTSAHPSPSGPLSKRILLALMALPIWVMIILLSPLDAYQSAKIIGNRI
jgi:hypothetical protein